MKRLLTTLTILLFSGVILGLLASFLYLQNRIYPNTYIAGVAVGGLTKAEALNLLRRRLADKRQNYLIFIYQNNEWLVDLRKIRFRPQPSLTVKKARNSRRLNLFLGKQQAFPLDYTFDQDKLLSAIATISARLTFPAQQPQLIVHDQEIYVHRGQNGQKLNQQLALRLVENNLAQLNFAPIKLPIEKLNFAVSKTEVKLAQKRAGHLLGKRLLVQVDGNTDTLTGQKLIDLIGFQQAFNRQKIATYTATLATSFNRPPQDATFRMQNDRVILFKPAKPGIELQQKAAIAQIQAALGRLEKQAAPTLAVSLSTKETQPQIANADVNNLGINQLLGRGVSRFTGSAASRIHNLSLAAARLNGILVPPGEIFSFNEKVGDISAATGYRSAYIIKQGRTILGDGGGVCQDSTTLFRAVLDAGLPIIERHPHSYRVVYYEQGGYKPGLDATVFAPNVDFKFKNDTPAHILIQSTVDRVNKQLTYAIYGTSDGRKVNISNHRVWDQIPPPAPLYQDDPTLPAGTVKQIDFAAWGAKAAFDWQVMRNGKVIIQRTFYSNFRPWQAVFLRGTEK